MTEGAPDRRVRRTKTRLKTALLELIEERGYEAITIRDLAERADVGRSTFYSHYGSKEDLLFDGFDRWLLSLAEGQPGEGGDGGAAGKPGENGSGGAGFRFVRPFLEHVRGQKRFFRATIAESPDPRVRRRLVELMAEVVRRELARGGSAPSAVPGVALDPQTVTDGGSQGRPEPEITIVTTSSLRCRLDIGSALLRSVDRSRCRPHHSAGS